jgi:hypothetical protein
LRFSVINAAYSGHSGNPDQAYPGTAHAQTAAASQKRPDGHLVAEDKTENEVLSKYHGKLSNATARSTDLAESARGPFYQL